MYTSLFKKDDVRITQGYSSSHRGLDLSRGVVESPVYFPNKAVSGEVISIISEYDYLGVHYKNAPIILIKHKDGSGSRYIHSYPKNVKVKVGDKVVAGQQVCCTGNSGHSLADHLHFEWLTNYKDLRTRVDPTNFVVNDYMESYKIGDKIVFTGVQNIRTGSGLQYKVLRDTVVGETATIKDGPRSADNYIWYDLIFENGSTGWVADVGKFKIYTIPPVTPPQPVGQTECEKEVERLKAENKGLNEALTASKSEVERLKNDLKLKSDRVVFLEENLKDRDEELKTFDTIKEERDRLEKEKLELEEEISKLKNENENNLVKKMVDFLNKLLKK